jgi:hypothetical protein
VDTAEYANRTGSKLPGSEESKTVAEAVKSNVAKCQDNGGEKDYFPFITGQNSKGLANALP